MALSDQEARAIEELEQQLAAEDPAFVGRFGNRPASGRRVATGWLRLALGVGLGLLPVAVATGVYLLGLIGFVLAAAAGVPLLERGAPIAVTRWRRFLELRSTSADRSLPPGSPSR